MTALTEDAVAIRRVRARGVPEMVLRHELARVATPRVRGFMFVRRVRVRADAARIGHALAGALAALAEDARPNIVSFADFPTLVVACARAAAASGLHSWHWRMLGLPSAAAPGEAVAILLASHPLEAGSAVAALAEQGLLAAVWRTMPEPVALQLAAVLAYEGGFAVPTWPDPDAAQMGSAPTALLERAAAMWAAPLALLPPRAEAVRTAAVIALLRWAPAVLRAPDHPAWPALLRRLTAADQPLYSPRVARTAPETAHQPAPVVAAGSSLAAPFLTPPDAAAWRLAAAPRDMAEAPSLPAHGEVIETLWAGVLFLINPLQRVGIEARLSALGAPTGWRVLHDLGVALGMPPDEALARFLLAQDVDTVTPPRLLRTLVTEIEGLYSPKDAWPECTHSRHPGASDASASDANSAPAAGLWPLPLAQPGRLFATETHLDLFLPATDVDIAVRLAGLDLDPGWVLWLGRIVAFHYDALPTFLARGA